MKVVKAAAVQISPVLYSREGTIEKVVRKIHELGQQGVQFAAGAAGPDPGRVTGHSEVIPGQKSAYGKCVPLNNVICSWTAAISRAGASLKSFQTRPVL